MNEDKVESSFAEAVATAEAKPRTLLLVEDDPDHVELFRYIFDRHGALCRVFHAKDGQDALDYLARKGAWAGPEKSPRPDVILLDLRMPSVDGLEVLRTIKSSENWKSIPVVVCTSSHADADLGEALRSHANAYLLKPFEFRKLARMLDDFCSFWLVWNRLPGEE